MRRRWPLWTIFTLCLLAGLSGMISISATALRQNRAEVEALRRGQIEETVRLALWRMDAAVWPLIAQETARRYGAYRALTPAQRAYTRSYNDIRGDVLLPSPLLDAELPLVRLNFQIDPNGEITSPQAPTGNDRDVISVLSDEELQNGKIRQRIAAATSRLEELRTKLNRQSLLAVLPDAPPTSTTYTASQPPAPLLAEPNAAPGARGFEQQQIVKNMQEFNARQNSGVNNTNFDLANNSLQLQLARDNVREGLMKPVWVDGQLLLARRVDVNGQTFVQGCWLDWPGLRQYLLNTVRDILPSASLQPAPAEDDHGRSRMLASIPVLLAPGHVPLDIQPAGLPVKMILSVAWAGMLIATAAAAALVWGAMRLSARRGAFVSAVTHELRTPLTTVSMYAEMLEGGMIGEDSRRQYLATLRCEAERLGHLVENVLAYSKIERGGMRGRIQTIGLPQLIDAARQRLDSRAAQARMLLTVNIAPAAASACVRADASAVEQILFNLVDNACKYANGSAERRIEMSADVNGRVALIRVRDCGPGISPAQARGLFRPFSKSVHDAANSAPGVGLGLALSRRLARQMSGDLRLEGGPGARFVLEVPIVERQP